MTEFAAYVEDFCTRLFEDIRKLTAGTCGVTREGYTPEEDKVHERLAEAAREIGLEVHADAALNLWMTLPGRNRDLPAFVSGSHSDSVPQGGNYDGLAGIVALLAVAWAAAILGDQCNFMIGHFFGKKIVESGKVKAMTPERLQKSEAFLQKWGHLAIFLGRFFPFIRTFVPFIAGMGGMHWRNFVIFNVLGGITWSTLFTLLGYFFGGIPFVQEHFELLIVGIVLVSVIPTIVGLVKAKLSKK